MGRAVIIKWGLSACSIVILVLIPLFKNNFYADVKVFRWQQLSWDHFQGFVKPFTGWGAGIQSGVYLEFDSLKNSYSAYSAMNNQGSWKKASVIESEYVLKHEQYHFNISEYHSRLMNKFLSENDNLSESDINNMLRSIRSDLRKMQSAYDNDTDHSLVKTQQMFWEYRIDSMLNSFNDANYVTDLYSGAQIYFPFKPVYSTGFINDRSSYREYSLNKYNMRLSLISHQYKNNLDINYLCSKIIMLSEQDSTEIIKMELDTNNQKFFADQTLLDTLNSQIIRQIWLLQGNNFYQVISKYPNSSSNELEYSQITNTFINSFKVKNTDSLWLAKFKPSSITTVHSISKALEGNESKGNYCITYGERKCHGFYRGPINSSDNLLFVYNIIDTPDSSIHESMAIFGTDVYSTTSDSTNNFVLIPKTHFMEKNFKFNLGYLLKEDSSKGCFTYYYQTVEGQLPNPLILK